MENIHDDGLEKRKYKVCSFCNTYGAKQSKVTGQSKAWVLNHSFIKHFLNYASDAFLGTGDAINKTEQDSALKILQCPATYLELICF